MKQRAQGFTLVELIVVMVVMGILAGILVTFFTPAISNYFATSRRAALSDVADGAMRHMSRDVRVSVPNSVRSWGNQCIETVPTSAGGRYRNAPDTQWDAAHTAPNLSAYAQPGMNFTQFDVFTDLSASANDWVVVGNQNPDDLYPAISTNRSKIASIAAPPDASLGRHRVTLASSMQVPAGYDGARFVVVPGGQGPVSYICQNAGIDPATGTGKGTLLRVTGYGFGGNSCPAPGANPAIVASHVASCTFRYDPNPGATQESGYVEVDITLQEANEFVRLFFGVHVDNVP